jgi:hypothetical protein
MFLKVHQQCSAQYQTAHEVAFRVAAGWLLMAAGSSWEYEQYMYTLIPEGHSSRSDFGECRRTHVLASSASQSGAGWMGLAGRRRHLSAMQPPSRFICRPLYHDRPNAPPASPKRPLPARLCHTDPCDHAELL